MKVVLASLSVIILALVSLAIAASGQAALQPVGAKTETVFASPGKMTAPIAMEYKFDAPPAAGRPLVVQLTFKAEKRSSIHVEVGGQASLGLPGGQRHQVLPGDSLELVIVPQRDGRHYLNVVAHLSANQVRVFQLPVQVGAEKVVKKAAKARPDAGGELLVRLPASPQK